MTARAVEKTVDIAAPPERVWHVLLDVEHDGFISGGREVTDGAAAECRGTHEPHRLRATGTGTHLAVSAPMGEEHDEAVVAGRDEPLLRVEQLAVGTAPPARADAAGADAARSTGAGRARSIGP